MKQLTPLETLQKELTNDARALVKSIEYYYSGIIDLDAHMVHRKNLEPRMKEFRNAIEKLKQ